MNTKELEFICTEGEGQYIEFKERPDRSLASEMVAFANAGGGKIFISITDAGQPIGFEATNRQKSQVQDLANNCDPPLLIGLVQSGNILIVEVKEGKNKPYKCREGFFIRIGPNAQKMSRDQILELCIKDGKIRFDEQVCAEFDFKDFDDDKFDSYMKLAHITNTLDKKDILANIHVLTDEGMTNAGVLFFCKKAI